MSRTQHRIKKAIFRERLRILELVEEGVTDFEIGEMPAADVLRDLATILEGQMAEMAEELGLTKETKATTRLELVNGLSASKTRSRAIN